MTDKEIIIEHGVKYPNGTYDWKVKEWFGDTDTQAAQDNFQEQYELRLAALGAEAGKVEFVQHTKTTTYSAEKPTDLRKLEPEMPFLLDSAEIDSK